MTEYNRVGGPQINSEAACVMTYQVGLPSVEQDAAGAGFNPECQPMLGSQAVVLYGVFNENSELQCVYSFLHAERFARGRCPGMPGRIVSTPLSRVSNPNVILLYLATSTDSFRRGCQHLPRP